MHLQPRPIEFIELLGSSKKILLSQILKQCSLLELNNGGRTLQNGEIYV